MIGTQTDNIEDARRKGRMTYPSKNNWWIGRGRSESQKIQASLARSKLSLVQIKEIFADPRSQQAIAKDYGVHRTVVQRIKSGAAFSKVLAQNGGS
jgi:DNA invertase Pin-like site-specific DNA recombinase